MVVVIIILAFVLVVLLAVLVLMFKRINKRFEQVEKSIEAQDALYDGFEDTVSRQYASYAGLSNRLLEAEGMIARMAKQLEKSKDEQ